MNILLYRHRNILGLFLKFINVLLTPKMLTCLALNLQGDTGLPFPRAYLPAAPANPRFHAGDWTLGLPAVAAEHEGQSSALCRPDGRISYFRDSYREATPEKCLWPCARVTLQGLSLLHRVEIGTSAFTTKEVKGGKCSDWVFPVPFDRGSPRRSHSCKCSRRMQTDS